MADERITSQLPAANPPPFTFEHEIALDYLKSNGTAWAQNRKGERLLADIAAAGFARKEGKAYVYTGNRDEHQRNQEFA